MNHPSREIIKEWHKQKEKLRIEKLESQTDGILDCCKLESALIITDEYQGIYKLLRVLAYNHLFCNKYTRGWLILYDFQSLK